MNIYLLMGQSNMIGRDGIREPGAADGHPRIRALDQQGEWVAAADPLPFVPPRIGVGPGMSFAQTMLEACSDSDKDAVIGLVPAAVGGTPLSRWERGGDLYEYAMERARLAQEAGTIAGVLWHQGERDTQERKAADSYGTRLYRMIRDVREELNTPELPWVAGGLVPDLVQRDVVIGFAEVLAALRNLPREVSHTAFVEATGLTHIGDFTHFTAASMREFGRRYAEAMLDLQGK